MDWLFGLFIGLTIALIGLLYFNGVFLVIRARSENVPNLSYLGVGFIIVATSFMGQSIFRIDGVFTVPFEALGYYFLLIMTNKTFYHDVPNKEKGSYLVGLILMVIRIALRIHEYLTPITLSSRLYTICSNIVYSFFIFFWFANAAHHTYRRIKDADVAPWIKYRYRLLSIGSYINAFHYFSNLIPTFYETNIIHYSSISTLTLGLILLFNLVYSILMTLAWVMPARLKARWNDREHYQPVTDSWKNNPVNMDEEEKRIMKEFQGGGE